MRAVELRERAVVARRFHAAEREAEILAGETLGRRGRPREHAAELDRSVDVDDLSLIGSHRGARENRGFPLVLAVVVEQPLVAPVAPERIERLERVTIRTEQRVAPLATGRFDFSLVARP